MFLTRHIMQFLLLLLLGSALASAQQQQCSAMYRDTGTPLLFGGVASSCFGSSCKSRATYWCEQDCVQGTMHVFRPQYGHTINI
jgi:hypothetical protein